MRLTGEDVQAALRTAAERSGSGLVPVETIAEALNERLDDLLVGRVTQPARCRRDLH